MKHLNKTALLLAVSLTALLVAGCSDKTELYANNQLAFQACLDSGGVPIQSWFNEKILGDCIYKPVGN